MDMSLTNCWDCAPSYIVQAITAAIVFAAPIGAIVMHRHYRGSRGWLRAMIVTLRVFAVLSAPFAAILLLGALAQIIG